MNEVYLMFITSNGGHTMKYVLLILALAFSTLANASMIETTFDDEPLFHIDLSITNVVDVNGNTLVFETDIGVITLTLDEFTINQIKNGNAVDIHIGVVRDTNVVPVPTAAWLFGSGLLGLVGVARRGVNSGEI